jgi:hypothetical protein
MPSVIARILTRKSTDPDGASVGSPSILYSNFSKAKVMKCPLVALNRLAGDERQCLLAGVKQTSRGHAAMAGSDPKRSSALVTASANFHFIYRDLV